MNVLCPKCRNKARLKIEFLQLRITPIPSQWDFTCFNCNSDRYGGFKLFERLVFYIIFFTILASFLCLAVILLSVSSYKLSILVAVILGILGFIFSSVITNQYLKQRVIVKLIKEFKQS